MNLLCLQRTAYEHRASAREDKFRLVPGEKEKLGAPRTENSLFRSKAVSYLTIKALFQQPGSWSSLATSTDILKIT